MKATLLFASTGVMVAITVGAIRIAGYRPGVLDNSVEWIFWAGAILAAAGVALFGVAAVRESSPDERSRLLPAGMTLFLLGPVLCTVAVFADYWI